jgi:hypothetical protein
LAVDTPDVVSDVVGNMLCLAGDRINKKKTSLHPSLVETHRLSMVDLVVISDTLVVVSFVPRVALHHPKQRQKRIISSNPRVPDHQCNELTAEGSSELSGTIVPWDTVPSDSSVKHDTCSGSTLEGTETDMELFCWD